jgi:hypothetical protein
VAVVVTVAALVELLEMDGAALGVREVVIETDRLQELEGELEAWHDGDVVDDADELGMDVELADGSGDGDCVGLTLVLELADGVTLSERATEDVTDEGAVEGEGDGDSFKHARSNSVEAIGYGGACCVVNAGSRPTA